MSYPKSYIPEGFTTVTPFIMVENAQEVVNFVKRAFDAEEISVLRAEDGTLQHAQMKIGNGIFLIGDTMGEHPPMPASFISTSPIAIAITSAASVRAVNR